MPSTRPLNIRISTLLDHVPQNTEKEMLLLRTLRSCVSDIIGYEERRKGGSEEPTRLILGTIKNALINLISFLEPEANSQFGIAIDLMGISIGQICGNYPDIQESWYRIAWILLWKSHEIQGENSPKLILLHQ